jgi:hypothetical protein
MDDNDKKLLALGVVILGLIASIPPGNIPSQSMIPGGAIISPGMSVSQSNPSAIAFQSITFAAGSMLPTILTFEEGPSTLTKLYSGLPLWLWAIIGGIILVNIILKFVNIEFKNIEGDETRQVGVNLIYMIVPLLSFLWLANMLTGGVAPYAVFYLFLIIIPIALLVFMKYQFKGLNFNICINDRVMGFFDVSNSTQGTLIIASTLFIFLMMSVFNTSYSSFAIGGDKLSTLAVVSPEDQALIYVPTLIIVSVGSVLWLSILRWFHGDDPWGVFEFDPDTIVQTMKEYKHEFASGLVVLVIMTSVFCSYVGANYHQNSYSQMAPTVAAQLGISEEEAYARIINDVSDFWGLASLSVSFSGSVIPADIVHFWVNYNASGG